MLTRLIIIYLSFINILLPCAVCYGNPEDPMSKGMNMGVLTLMGFIVFILSIIAYSILSLFLKSKKIEN